MVRECVGDVGDLGGGFVDEFEPNMRNASLSPARQMLARFLGLCAKHSVTATNIRHHRMRSPVNVLQGDAVFLARVATILVAGAVG